MPALRRHWTPDAVRALTDESRAWPRYELIDGELLVTPAPAAVHQLIVMELAGLLHAYLRVAKTGVVLTSPADLVLRPQTITQPDVFVIPATTRIAGEQFAWSDVTSLLLAVEVLSPSTQRADRATKRDFYLENRVAEYWVVDVDGRAIERWTAADATPRIERGVMRWNGSESAAPFELDVRALFERTTGTSFISDAD